MKKLRSVLSWFHTALIHSLFVPSRPAAVSRSIWPIVISSIKRPARRAWPHISKECREIILPLLTHCNTAPSPILKTFGARIKAATLRVSPNLVLPQPVRSLVNSISVLSRSSDRSFGSKASATSSAAALENLAKNNGSLTTDALAEPLSASSPIVRLARRSLDDRQPPERPAYQARRKVPAWHVVSFFVLAFAICHIPYHVEAQVVTPNLGLVKPEAEPGTWGQDINNNFDKLDNQFPGGQSGHTVQDEGVNLAPRQKLNFTGSGVTAADNPATGATDVSITSGGGAAHTIQDEATPLTQRPNLNFTGGGIACSDNSVQNRTDCTVPTGIVDQSTTYTWTGPHSWRSGNWSLLDSADTSKILKWDLSGFTTSTTRTFSLPNASTRLLGDADFSGVGFMARTGAGTYASRTLQGTTNRVTITPGDGSANPVINLGSLAVQTDQTNTYTAGAKQIFSHSATTAGVNIGPVAGDPSTPANGDVWYNSSTNKFRKRENGSTTDLDTTGGAVAFSAVTAGSNVNALSIGSGGVLNTTGTGTIVANRTSCGAGQYLAFDGTCPAAAASLDQSAAYTWTGANSWRSGSWSLLDTADTSKILKWDVSGITPSTTRTLSVPNANTRLVGDSDFSATGIMVRTGAGTYAGRTLQGTANRVVFTSNPGGVGGDPVINLGSLAVQTDQSNAFSAGDQDFGAAASFTFPKASGATPTLSGRCAYDTTANRLKCGFNGTTVMLSISSEVQALNANLTALSALSGATDAFPMFTGAGTMTTKAIPSCIDSAGQHLNWNGSWTCGTTSTGGLSGATTGNYLIATGATSFGTSGTLKDVAGVANASGGLSVGNVATNKLTYDTSAVTGTKTWTIPNASGTIAPCTTAGGALTDGHIVKLAVAGAVVTCIDGGVAGTGTWTDSSTNTGTNKTIQDALAGGTGNHVWTPLRANWDGGSLTADGTVCADPVKSTISGGPTGYFVICSHSTSGTFDGQVAIPLTTVGNLSTLKLTLTVNDVDSSSQHFSGTFKAMCRNNGAVVDGTWGATQSVDIVMTSANTNYTATTAALTPNGTCSAGATLFWRFTITNSGGTDDDGDARVVNVAMEQQS